MEKRNGRTRSSLREGFVFFEVFPRACESVKTSIALVGLIETESGSLELDGCGKQSWQHSGGGGKEYEIWALRKDDKNIDNADISAEGCPLTYGTWLLEFGVCV